jgi:hypothetical protein
MSEVAQPQPVTPELRQWIIDQAKAGVQPESVLQSMMASGWREDVAIAALEDTLRGFLDERAKVAQLPPAVPVPDPLPALAGIPTARCASCWPCATRGSSCSAGCFRTRNATS